MIKRITLSILVLLIPILITPKWPNDLVHVVFCDVGQGDATLVQVGFAQALIDTGPNDSVLSCLEEHMPFWDKQIELLFLTHRDKDHIGGLKYISDYYSFKYIFVNPSNKKTSDFSPLERLSSSESEKNPSIITLFSGSVIYLTNSVKFEVFWPIGRDFTRKSQIFITTETTLSDTLLEYEDKYLIKSNENNLSIGLKLIIGDVSVVLPGDLEEEVELALASVPLLDNIDILKAGHHGSKSSSTRLFLEKLLPEKIIVSSGKNNQFGHPHAEVLERFEDVKARVFLTSSSGTLHFVSDLRSFWLENSH